ncbi:hypothetical protein SAMN04489712_107117 [Thermomonospora echinospora]|uniref:Uncharacterized protein n=1 Tax=Thermomonospora echinospora TaxID=1992 RepID=A0A1H6BHQ3_9ACTN|nr:hypothetical protein [Thermomonospora echinospora]SEG60230.1 hypothetical protein SAMN04489712_107117 [Thermomonospora echinospora]
MGDRRRGHALTEGETGRITRFVILTLGLLGFVVFPGAGPSPVGSGIGPRTGAAQPPPAHQAPGRGRAGTAGGATGQTSTAETRSVASSTSAAPPYTALQEADPVTPAGGAEIALPRRSHTVPPDTRTAVPTGPRSLPSRGRAPPASTGS